MKTKFISVWMLIVGLAMFSLKAAGTPDFSCVGFAAMNGGTTGGQGGPEVTVTNLTQFKKYVSEKDATFRIIYVNGTLEGAGGGEIVAIGSNKTIIGIGTKGKVSKVQFYCKNSQNLILRNLFFSMKGSTLGSDADCISIATTASSKCRNIWVDHCTFDNEVQPVINPSASQKDQYDGLLDIKKNSEYITVSWCVFKNHYKGILVGYTTSDTYDRKITMHHNAFININSRTPSYRGGTAHIYNNYWDGCKDAASGKYFSTGINCREGACLKVESNFFKNMDKTIYCAWDDVSKPGYANWSNNLFDNANPPESDPQFQSCTSFTPPYEVTVDAASEVYSLVNQYAGVGIIEDPANIPDPEDDGTNPPAIEAPYLEQPTNINESGFHVSWNAVEGAAKYILTYSYEEENPNAYIFKETFDQMNVGDNITGNTTDNGPDSFVSKEGRKLTGIVCEEKGSIKLTGDRFCIDKLDLTGNPVLTVKVKAVSGTGAFQVALDKSGTTGVSGLINRKCTDISNSDFETITTTIAGGTSSSYIQFRTESNTTVYISEISISADGNASKTILKNIELTDTDYTFTELTNGEEYAVYVVAQNGTGDKSYKSNVIYATPTAPSAIEKVNADSGEIISTQYYSLSGKIVPELQQPGIYIKRSIYRNGSVKTEKIIRY